MQFEEIIFEPEYVEITDVGSNPNDPSDYSGAQETFCIHCWTRRSADCRVGIIVVLFHGLSAHGRYPTVQYLAEAILGTGPFPQGKEVVIYSVDLPGHGLGRGTPGLLRPAPELGPSALFVARWLSSMHADKPVVFAGTSMGAAIAIAAAVENQKEPGLKANGKPEVRVPLASLLLVAPFLGVTAEDLPAAPVLWLLRGLSNIIPSLPAIKAKAQDASAQYKDEERREKCTSDELQYNGKLRLGSAASLVDLGELLFREYLPALKTKFLILEAGAESVVDKEGAKRMMEATVNVPDSDKERFVVPGALHGIFCEPDGEVRRDAERRAYEWVLKAVQ